MVLIIGKKFCYENDCNWLPFWHKYFVTNIIAVGLSAKDRAFVTKIIAVGLSIKD